MSNNKHHQQKKLNSNPSPRKRRRCLQLIEGSNRNPTILSINSAIYDLPIDVLELYFVFVGGGIIGTLPFVCQHKTYCKVRTVSCHPYPALIFCKEAGADEENQASMWFYAACYGRLDVLRWAKDRFILKLLEPLDFHRCSWEWKMDTLMRCNDWEEMDRRGSWKQVPSLLKMAISKS